MQLQHLLTAREIEIVKLIVAGLTDDAIGGLLAISKHTVSTHRKNVLTKLSLPNTASLVRVAMQNGLYQDSPRH